MSKICKTVVQNCQNMPKSECRHPQITVYRGLFKNRNGSTASFGYTLAIFFLKKTSCNNKITDQISIPYYVTFQSCSVKCISSFMLRHLMTS